MPSPDSVPATPSCEQSSNVKMQSVLKAEPRPANFTINTAGGERSFSYESLFIQGHQLWRKRDFAKAFKVFDLLSSATDRGPRASILKAHCAAMEQKFSDCSAILWQSLPKVDYADAASSLHDIFVLWRFKFYNEVRKELEQFVLEISDLPTPALLLGDLFSLAGHYDKAMKYFQLAQERDRERGSIALIAITTKDKLRSKSTNQANH